MILVIIFTLAALTIIGAIIYGVQENKKKASLEVSAPPLENKVEQLVTRIEAGVDQLVTKSKKQAKTQPAKMSAKPKKSTPKVTKTK